MCACVLHREIVGEQKYKGVSQTAWFGKKKKRGERRERKREESSERKERETRLVTWAQPK